MSPWKCNRRIIFGVTGGIAAYKAPDILRGWRKQDCEVDVILTRSAEEFVSPLVLSTLTGRKVWRERDFLSAEEGWKIPHITLTERAEVFVIAPCTANVLRMCAQGDGSTLLGAAMLANRSPLVIFPAMNPNMLQNPAVRANIETIRKMGHKVVDPDSGMLACGYEGKGRLPNNSVIYEHVWHALSPKKDLSGMKVMVTAGPTHEYIDPVRYISNPSSGKMGYAIAKAAWYRGADVTLVSGPVSLQRPEGVRVIDVVSADQMYEACVREAPAMDIIIKAAAVGDFRAEEEMKQKIKRRDGEPLTVTLVQNRDIAAELGKMKREDQLLVGFAAETEDLVANAQKKMAAKNLDMIACNDVLANGAGFASDTNTLMIMTKGGSEVEISGTKEDVADTLLDAIIKKKNKG
ncbi:MAG TPA: bifunctional phosphopantothenoylcysteine decarboxylase/phosphopantothenate--cysteine ligase CoaBC [Synergistaceae bacterium]|jgi:phosphopantothenoylcysteine decarboxylase/phosphopantothenate--cysteine ligase|nr:bifunctional phosphopantothenoylcysteine decarboxylase/phosphopantothenate--cysteine ligase CoaBC [Synergistaceae bacterium]NLL41262.1 bifunctional phosphopantothenoylcysteine decarboxylase/phosphopantothenate--cysteine ligase CoaBC [Synergistaceae bacterium]HPX03152.1 bifunctional phosphopantothenoylcysteine decarboxylase/phosphopantothenate--cysteine ligase CoaBC [Synergistaceae bacterium]HQA53988.1 bifunctional phosphopantothenoylcysteine decarboxylase/phosphopantothenate--cysteine ligase 